MKKIFALVTLFVGHSALAGVCYLNTTETYIYDGSRTPLSQVEVYSQSLGDCYQKAQSTANFVYSTNIQNSVTVRTTAVFQEGNYVFPGSAFYGQYIPVGPFWEQNYPYLLRYDGYVGLYSTYHYRRYNVYPVGIYYQRPGVRRFYETRTYRESRIVEHRTTYERSRTTTTTTRIEQGRRHR